MRTTKLRGVTLTAVLFGAGLVALGAAGVPQPAGFNDLKILQEVVNGLRRI